MIKKIFSTLFILALLLLIAWLLAGWYFGKQAEQAFMAAIQENRQLTGEKIARLELLSYQRKLFGAEAKLRLSSDIPFISERISEIDINVNMLNGPIFITKSDISLGSSRWLVSIDESSLSPENIENVRDFFPNTLPKAIVRLGFDNKSHYLLRAKTYFANTLITGILDLDSLDNRGAITLDNFTLDVAKTTISANKINISFQHQKAISATYKPGTSSMQIPTLRIRRNTFPKSLNLALTVQSNISRNDNYLSGFIKAKIKQEEGAKIPIDTAQLSLLFKGISANGFVAFSEAHAELDNLRQQAQWALEESGEFPEGQDQIWQLYDQIDSSSQQLAGDLLSKMLSDDSLFQFKANSSTKKQGKSEIIGILKAKKPPKNVKNRGGVFNKSTENILNTIIRALQGEANVRLDEKLYTSLKDHLEINKKDFKLRLNDNEWQLQ